MVRLIFLDIDGVLAPFAKLHETKRVCQDILGGIGCLDFDPECVDRLNRICQATGAKIVISSSWRHYIRDIGKMRAMFKAQGVTGEVVGMTPEAEESWPDYSRGAEIKKYLLDNDKKSLAYPFVIIDDADMGFAGLERRWIKTNGNVGLQEEDANRAIAMLYGVGKWPI